MATSLLDVERHLDIRDWQSVCAKLSKLNCVYLLRGFSMQYGVAPLQIPFLT